jgi:hypothetical protein
MSYLVGFEKLNWRFLVQKKGRRGEDGARALPWF